MSSCLSLLIQEVVFPDVFISGCVDADVWRSRELMRESGICGSVLIGFIVMSPRYSVGSGDISCLTIEFNSQRLSVREVSRREVIV